MMISPPRPWGRDDIQGDGDEGGSAPHEDHDWVEHGLTPEGESVADRLDASFDNLYPDDGRSEPAASPELLDNWKSMPGANGANAADSIDLDEFVAGRQTLRDHVAQHIALGFADPVDRLIASEIADHLDEAGYVHIDDIELAARLGVEEDRIVAVLSRLQECDPAGLFARSLSECLALQLAQRNRLDPAMQALIANLDRLARRDFQSLRRICGVDDEDLVDMLAEIRALDPKPGLAFESGPCETVVPDVIVRPMADGRFAVELSAETLPRVLVNQKLLRRSVAPLGLFAGGAGVPRRLPADGQLADAKPRPARPHHPEGSRAKSSASRMPFSSMASAICAR
jgi:RNA polymerase sigma-54 factor